MLRNNLVEISLLIALVGELVWVLEEDRDWWRNA